jgi:hypothetical protein
MKLTPASGANPPQTRGALAAGRFDEVFAAGARLNLREAVAAVRDRRGAGTTPP